jgi:GNAT superfamily N-acetyltransferase
MTASPGSSPEDPSSDLSVRIGWADDAAYVAEVQLRAWRERYADLLPAEALPTGDPAEVGAAAAQWQRSMQRPGDARNRVLVALDRQRVVGLAVTQPAADPDCDPVADAELAELAVHPDERRRGHGSRLLQAAVDTARADRFGRLVCWLVASDDPTRAFLSGAGWAPDGAHRTLDLTGDGSVTVKQVRLHTSLS